MKTALAASGPGPLETGAAWARLNIAVLLPCYNEGPTIARVVGDFRRTVPDATIYVYDNNSTDDTVAEARRAGALVRRELLQGKGHVIRRMFADIEADAYILVDGDGTYEPEAAPRMLDLLVAQGLDMVTGNRIAIDAAAYRTGHRFGNRMLTGLVRLLFGAGVQDMLSGYRVFSRRFVKSFPALAAGFEAETEFTVHALELRVAIGEIDTQYIERSPGSASKLHTIRDGIRILRTILVLVKEERPLQMFSAAALVFLALGLGLGLPVVAEFLRTGLVLRLPTAVLALGFVLLSFLSLLGGLILDSVCRVRREMKRMAFLGIAGINARLED